jgi:SOS-response transcriptional repressor LexA
MASKQNNEDDLDPIRKLVITRIREVGLDLAGLSRAIGKNATYMHQYMWRKSPKVLLENERNSLSQLLGIPEDQLRAPQQRSRIPCPKPVANILTHDKTAIPKNHAELTELPVFTEGGAIDLARAEEWTPRPPLLRTAGQAFALWISHDRGRRLMRGDLAFVQGNQTARVGDIVAVIRGAELVMIGDLIKAGDGFVQVGGETKRDRIKTEPGDRLLKIVGVRFG